MELLARLIEHRLCARELDGDGDAVAAHELALLAHIGVGDDHRILDHRLHLLREQAVEAAVERHARDHGNQDRGDRGDDGEQGDDAHVQPRRRAPAAPRLHDPPHLAPDDQDEEKNRDALAASNETHDLVGRRDRGEAPEHDEGDERRQEGERDGPKTQRPRHPSGCRRCGCSGQISGGGLADVGHQLVSPQTGTRDSAYARPLGGPLLIAGIFH